MKIRKLNFALGLLTIVVAIFSYSVWNHYSSPQFQGAPGLNSPPEFWNWSQGIFPWGYDIILLVILGVYLIYEAFNFKLKIEKKDKE